MKLRLNGNDAWKMLNASWQFTMDDDPLDTATRETCDIVARRVLRKMQAVTVNVSQTEAEELTLAGILRGRDAVRRSMVDAAGKHGGTRRQAVRVPSGGPSVMGPRSGRRGRGAGGR